MESPRPLGLDKGKLLENWGRGLDKQAYRTLLYNYLPKATTKNLLRPYLENSLRPLYESPGWLSILLSSILSIHY
jgi:hypothetical protein